MNLSEAFRLAAVVVSRVSAFDQTVPADSEVLLDSWARQIVRTSFNEEELIEGVLRAYESGGEVPRNKLGAVLAGARVARKEARKRDRETAERRLELEPGRYDSFAGEPSQRAYCKPLAPGSARPLDVPCSVDHCGAGPGEVCEDKGVVRRVPHIVRGLRSMNTKV